MEASHSDAAQRIAQAACEFEWERSGHRPASATVVVCDDTVVVSLPGVMSPVELDLAKNPAGAACVRELHRQVFANSCAPLAQKIGEIAGVNVLEGRSELWTETGKVVQMFLLAGNVAASSWSGSMGS